MLHYEKGQVQPPLVFFVPLQLDYENLLKNLNLPSMAKGVKPGINRHDVYGLKIPLPPLDEQKRIVSILDQAFEGLDRARANAEANLESNLELLASTITRETNTRWDARFCKPLGDICDLYQGLAINKKTKHLLVDKSSNPLLRIKDLRDGSEELYVDESGYPPNAKVDVNDIIYTRTGQIGLVFSGRRGVLHNNCFKVVPRAGIVREYLFWALQGHTFKKKIICPNVIHV